jgi:hypothetical protein
MIDEPIGQVGRLTGVGQLNDRIADQGVSDRGQRFAKASLRGKLFAAMDLPCAESISDESKLPTAPACR